MHSDPDAKELAALLRDVGALLRRPGNDYLWSSWRDDEHALDEVGGLLAQLEAGRVPDAGAVGILFVATGPMQEVAMSSGWGDRFLELADRFDEVALRLWPRA